MFLGANKRIISQGICGALGAAEGLRPFLVGGASNGENLAIAHNRPIGVLRYLI
jgi:hypothetical protein